MTDGQIFSECRYCGAHRAVEITRAGDQTRVWLCEHCKRVRKEAVKS